MFLSSWQSGDLGLDPHEKQEEIEKKKEVEEMESALGKEILKEEIIKTKVDNLDPRSASRTPSAKKEPPMGTRYASSVNAGNHITMLSGSVHVSYISIAYILEVISQLQQLHNNCTRLFDVLVLV